MHKSSVAYYFIAKDFVDLVQLLLHCGDICLFEIYESSLTDTLRSGRKIRRSCLQQAGSCCPVQRMMLL